MLALHDCMGIFTVLSLLIFLLDKNHGKQQMIGQHSLPGLRPVQLIKHSSKTLSIYLEILVMLVLCRYFRFRAFQVTDWPDFKVCSEWSQIHTSFGFMSDQVLKSKDQHTTDLQLPLFRSMYFHFFFFI